MHLTGIVGREDATTADPDPFGDVSEGLPEDQLIRGVGATVDTTGLLWICEKIIPRANSRRNAATEAAPDQEIFATGGE